MRFVGDSDFQHRDNILPVFHSEAHHQKWKKPESYREGEIDSHLYEDDLSKRERDEGSSLDNDYENYLATTITRRPSTEWTDYEKEWDEMMQRAEDHEFEEDERIQSAERRRDHRYDEYGDVDFAYPPIHYERIPFEYANSVFDEDRDGHSLSEDSYRWRKYRSNNDYGLDEFARDSEVDNRAPYRYRNDIKSKPVGHHHDRSYRRYPMDYDPDEFHDYPRYSRIEPVYDNVDIGNGYYIYKDGYSGYDYNERENILPFSDVDGIYSRRRIVQLPREEIDSPLYKDLEIEQGGTSSPFRRITDRIRATLGLDKVNNAKLAQSSDIESEDFQSNDDQQDENVIFTGYNGNSIYALTDGRSPDKLDELEANRWEMMQRKRNDQVRENIKDSTETDNVNCKSQRSQYWNHSITEPDLKNTDREFHKNISTNSDLENNQNLQVDNAKKVLNCSNFDLLSQKVEVEDSIITDYDFSSTKSDLVDETSILSSTDLPEIHIPLIILEDNTRNLPICIETPILSKDGAYISLETPVISKEGVDQNTYTENDNIFDLDEFKPIINDAFVVAQNVDGINQITEVVENTATENILLQNENLYDDKSFVEKGFDFIDKGDINSNIDNISKDPSVDDITDENINVENTNLYEDIPLFEKNLDVISENDRQDNNRVSEKPETVAEREKETYRESSVPNGFLDETTTDLIDEKLPTFDFLTQENFNEFTGELIIEDFTDKRTDTTLSNENLPEVSNNFQEKENEQEEKGEEEEEDEKLTDEEKALKEKEHIELIKIKKQLASERRDKHEKEATSKKLLEEMKATTIEKIPIEPLKILDNMENSSESSFKVPRILVFLLSSFISFLIVFG